MIMVSTDLMDKWIQIDEIVDNYLLHLCPINIGSKLAQIVHVLH